MTNDEREAIAAAMERHLLAEDRRREWSRMSSVERVATWLREISVDVPGITIEAMPDASWNAKIEITWHWATFQRYGWRCDIETVAGQTYVLQQIVSPHILEDRDQYFSYFERFLRRAVQQAVLSVVNKQLVVKHESLDEYIERRRSKRAAP